MMYGFPITVNAMIHSLHDIREVSVTEKTGNNQYLAVYGDKLCTAIYNPFSEKFYVDDIYGIVKEIKEEQENENR